MRSVANKNRALVVGLLALVGLFAAGWMLEPLTGRADSTPHRAQPAARTSLPGLSPASGEPTLASLDAPAPPRGKAVQAPGPFDDRFTLTGLAFDGSRVTGTATITSDVSDILEFEALAGFYDASGRLLGTARSTYHHDEAQAHASDGEQGTPNELEKFSISVPANMRGKAVSAAVGVPVLVNE
ncbi:hypothetical protein ACFUC1_01440 [Pedococcus sp. NPDC057267]|uniref:hypothetical protein n=1 Tax=Pedococcus sp. NPDC057267 TaxID=3346077 RepID=UPI00362A2B90